MKRKSKRRSRTEEAHPFRGLSQVNPNAAAVDIGAEEIVVCVSGPENTQIVKTFGNYTADLQAIGRWLKEHHVKMVAMESTGVYWIPLFEELERQGFECLLISSRSLRIHCGEWREERVTSPMRSGSRPYTHMACWRDRFVHRETWWRYELYCAIAANWWSTALPIFYICKKRFCK